MAKFPPRVCQPDEWRRLSDNPKFINIEENRELRAIPAKLAEKKTRRENLKETVRQQNLSSCGVSLRMQRPQNYRITRDLQPEKNTKTLTTLTSISPFLESAVGQIRGRRAEGGSNCDEARPT